MRIHVGPYVYRCIIADRSIVHEGRRLRGCVSERQREIQISPDVLPEHRLEILLHELHHAYGFHFPEARTAEEKADLFAAISSQAMKDLDEQGGEMVLMMMSPPTLPDPVVVPVDEPVVIADDEVHYAPSEYIDARDSKAKPSGYRAECGICEMVFGGGQIVSGEPRYSMEVGGWVIGRSVFCPHCRHVMSWTSALDFSGEHPSVPVGEAKYHTGRHVEQFLHEHPEAAGMMVV